MLGVRLSEELEDRIERYIETAKMTKSEFVKHAIDCFLRQQELKQYHNKMTKQGFKDIDEGDSVPGDVVFKMMKQWTRDE